MAAFLLANIVGLVRQILILDRFGAGPEVDALVAGQRLPDILFNLVAGGALASAFVPSFTAFLTRNDAGAAWRLASGVMTLAAAALVVLSALAAWQAPAVITYVLAAGFATPGNEAQFALSVRLLRILLISPAIFGVSGLLMGILNAHQRFLLPALAPSFYWLGMIAGLLALTPSLGIEGLAWGAVLGSALHLVVQLPGLRGLRPVLRPYWGWSDPNVRSVFLLMGPRLLGVAAVQLNFVVSTTLATLLTPGSLAALSVAWQVFTMPQVVIAQAIAVAALPTFSRLVAQGDQMALRASVADTLRSVLYLALPATIGLIVLPGPIVSLLFERGQFDAVDTALVAQVLVAYAIGLTSHSVLEIVVRAFHANRDTWTPVWVGVLAMLLNVGLNFALVPLGAPGLALANTIATTLEVVVLLVLLRRLLQGLNLGRLRRDLALMGVACAAMALGLWVMRVFASGWPAVGVALVGVAAGAVLYGAVTYGLHVTDARLLPALVGRRLGRASAADDTVPPLA
jgi:putative peptidoglycan lipid II flippase